MKKRELISRYAIFVIGLFLLSAGVSLIIRSTLGTTPISSVNYVMSVNTPLTLGAWTFIINILLIIGQFIILGSGRTPRDTVEILLQIPFSFLFGAFIDLNLWLTSSLHPSGYMMAIGILLVGCLVQSIGVVFEIKPKVAMMSAEAFIMYASRRWGKPFGKLKVAFDLTLVTSAVLISLLLSHRIDGIREGSLIAASVTGFIVTFLARHIITRRNLNRLRSALPTR
ncbi:MAG: hypothetical protein K2L55_04530 [Muribaculaceae bacterium]|nr:hypothetical protein [Muribaculaceae bacterium]MDE6345916.1 hypothetical protein [Muribaculaceae bacterium]